MLTVALLAVTRMYYKGSIYNLFIPVVVKRDQAKRLALSGVHIAIAQLALHDSELVPLKGESSKDEQDKQQKPEQRRKDLLKTVLHVLNNWQTFTLEEVKDGVDGEVKICITSENGKIPLQALIDYKKREFIKTDKIDGAEILKFVSEKLKTIASDVDFMECFTRYIKNIPEQMTDIGQLLTIKELKPLARDFFYEPLFNQEGQEGKKTIYLADLFTIWNQSATIDPLVLSPSVRFILGCEYPSGKTDIESEQIQMVAEKFPFSYASWQKDWDTYLKPIYKQEYKTIAPAFLPLLSGKFEPRVFSVLSYGKIGRINQKLLAIVERSFTDAGEVFAVKRLYWL
ncbi:hypothetical protein EBU24_02395 [bacterium]|nr:hypothetical protein [bacterium]